MSLGLTLSIIFAIVFSVALFFGFVYEKELKEFETIVFKYVKLVLKAKKAGVSVEEYVRMKKSGKTIKTEQPSNIIYFEDWAA
ncbi:MAG: hypothetical protein E7536_08370 [Ruminococcaceae bacterium]|nr:hypothetical protein [Oscillospiraceae bacterium]